MKYKTAEKSEFEVRKAITTKISGVVLTVIATMGSAQLMAENSLTDALKSGDAKLDFRYRIENVDERRSGKDAAWASTLKSRFTFTTAKWNNWQAQLEVDDVSSLGNGNYNSKKNGLTSHSVVADPEGTGVNQAWVAYTGFDHTTIKHGRTRVLLDNQRFVGGVGWRQNEQTYDVTAVVNSSISNTTIFLAKVRDIQGILGDAVSTNSNLVNIKYRGGSKVSWSAYLYDLDNISTTRGLRFSGSPKWRGNKVHYELEKAWQKEKGSAASYNANYSHLVIGITAGNMTAKIGLEVQESDSGLIAFSTPLGTNHKFNGWADRFLATPADGLEDSYLSVSAKLKDFKLAVVYHDFEAEQGSKDYGDEIDLSVSTEIAKNITALIKYADYDGAGGKVDARKIWLQLQFKF